MKLTKQTLSDKSRPRFAQFDPRLKVTKFSKKEPRIHFCLNCGFKSCPPIRVYAGRNLEQENIMSMVSGERKRGCLLIGWLLIGSKREPSRTEKTGQITRKQQQLLKSLWSLRMREQDYSCRMGKYEKQPDYSHRLWVKSFIKEYQLITPSCFSKVNDLTSSWIRRPSSSSRFVSSPRRRATATHSTWARSSSGTRPTSARPTSKCSSKNPSPFQRYHPGFTKISIRYLCQCSLLLIEYARDSGADIFYIYQSALQTRLHE